MLSVFTSQAALSKSGYSAYWESKTLAEPGEKADEDSQSSLDVKSILWRDITAKRNTLGERIEVARSGGCMESIVYNGNGYTQMKCRTHSLLCHDPMPPVENECQEVREFIPARNDFITTDCVCRTS